MAFLVALSGCSAIIDPDPTRLGGSSDAGAQVHWDAGPPPQYDAGTTPLPDSGPRPPLDAGTPCVVAPHCDGDTLVSCVGGVEARTNCQDMGAFCATDRCEPWVCTPGERTCADDGRGVVVCGARGDREMTMACDFGCDPATSTCLTISPSCAGLMPIAVGDMVPINLCSESDDDTYVRGEGCGADTRANVGDRTYVLTIPHAMDVEIELSDNDGTTAIDTVVYVRNVCDDASTQIACDDDVPCSESTIPLGFGDVCTGSEVRQSRIATRLGPGTYYIVADAFQYDTSRARYQCGNVRLRVTER